MSNKKPSVENSCAYTTFHLSRLVGAICLFLEEYIVESGEHIPWIQAKQEQVIIQLFNLRGRDSSHLEESRRTLSFCPLFVRHRGP